MIEIENPTSCEVGFFFIVFESKCAYIFKNSVISLFFENKRGYIFKNSFILLFLENKQSYIFKNPKWVNKVSMSLFIDILCNSVYI